MLLQCALDENAANSSFVAKRMLQPEVETASTAEEEGSSRSSDSDIAEVCEESSGVVEEPHCFSGDLFSQWDNHAVASSSEEEEVAIEWVPASLIHFGDQIGPGNFGHAYEARIGGETKVVKKLNAVSDATREEIVKLARCQHTNLLPLGFCAEPFAIIMPFSPACLFQRLHNRPSPPLHEYRVLSEVASALAYLHRREVCHAALKSENVLLDHKDTVALSDFGIGALIPLGNSMLKSRKHRARTMSYRAPELLSRRVNLTFKSDVYAFGVLSWEVGSKKVPYNKMSAMDIEELVEDGHREKLEDVPDSSLRPLVERAWAQKPCDRPEIQELVDELSTLWFESVREMARSLGV
jgi:serine/threonine protein kinase